MKKKKTKSVRRQAFMTDLPRRASIPKFLRPDEIQKVKDIKKVNPGMEWDEAVEQVVFGSVNLSTVLS